MTASYPKVQVYKKNNPIKQQPGMAGKVALIGVFGGSTTEPILTSNPDEAYTNVSDDKTKDAVKCIKPLFNGASSVLCVNVSELSTENLTGALAKIKNEKFNTLYVAGALTDAFLPIITGFCAERLLNKMPVGFGYAITRSTLEQYTTTAGLFGDYSYGGVTGQTFTVDGESLSLVESGAYWTGLISGLNVGNSMTKKIVDGVTGLTPEYVFEPTNNGFNGLNLLQLGLTTFECFDRENELYACVNSEQPNGYDLYINRVRDYVINEMALHDFLGNKNTPVTMGQVEQELDRVKDKCVSTLDLLSDIEYNIVKKSANCIDVNITRLLFAGIITDIDVYFTIEVE